MCGPVDRVLRKQQAVAHQFPLLMSRKWARHRDRSDTARRAGVRSGHDRGACGHVAAQAAQMVVMPLRRDDVADRLVGNEPAHAPTERHSPNRTPLVPSPRATQGDHRCLGGGEILRRRPVERAGAELDDQDRGSYDGRRRHCLAPRWWSSQRTITSTTAVLGCPPVPSKALWRSW